jgi:thymidine phosphorylase
VNFVQKETQAFDAVDIIRIKRDKGVLTPEQIDWTIDAYTRGVIADEQMAALNMAILLNGMDRAEIARWTGAMIASGERMDFSSLKRPDGGVKPTSDKHSTGGVGDKITLPLAPLVAVFGVAVPQLSGRGLGHTGGTLDKLESIPGWRAALSNEEILAQLQDVGAVICAAVRAGEPLMTLLTDTPEKFARAKEALENAVTVAPDGSRPAQQLIIDRIA